MHQLTGNRGRNERNRRFAKASVHGVEEVSITDNTD